MKKMDKRLHIRLCALALTAILLGTGAALASGGDQTDPLVTLSYLEQTAIPQIISQVEEKTAARQKELERSFAGQIEAYKQGGSPSSPTGGSASYTLLTLSRGQVLRPAVGCELLLRVGAASVQAGGSPALIDLSSAGIIENGASLTKNHLYMSTIEGRAVTATADTVKLLVRGGYSVT